ncbi:MAG: (2Fe-2S) ferredoxin domain-containing protein [Planctomycetota bacterium]|jgi:NADH:ubiquinone oxidoreductase subunit E|nr:(2Fe-2S) ferredoxin domain-containing protein [Planctomycetota bacterium]
MSGKIEIALCMGSSCFARGNNLRLESLERLVEARGWEERVIISGLRCGNLCSSGPNLRIDGELHQNLDEGALLDLIEAKVGGRSAAAASVRLKDEKAGG